MTLLNHIPAVSQTGPHYSIVKSGYDASRPYLVFNNRRSFNRVMGAYAQPEQAARRVRDLTNR